MIIDYAIEVLLLQVDTGSYLLMTPKFYKPFSKKVLHDDCNGTFLQHTPIFEISMTVIGDSYTSRALPHPRLQGYFLKSLHVPSVATTS